MKPLILLAAMIPAALCLSACNTVFGSGQNFDTFLKHMDGCDRDYQLAFGGSVPSVNGSAIVHCKAQPNP